MLVFTAPTGGKKCKCSYCILKEDFNPNLKGSPLLEDLLMLLTDNSKVSKVNIPRGSSHKAGTIRRRKASCCSEVDLPVLDFSFCSLRNCWRKLPSLTNLLETEASFSVPSSLNRKKK